MNPTIAREFNQPETGKLRKEAQMIMKEAETKNMEECSFKPEINQYEYTEDTLTQEERWRRLLEPKTTKIQQLEKAKVEKERKEVAETCSFKPKIQKPPQPDYKTKQEIINRLHSEANKREEKREKLKRKIEEERMKECSFKPALKKERFGSTRSISVKPLYERVDEVQKRKNEILVELKVEAELNDENLKFKPQVNKNSEKLYKNKLKKQYGSDQNLNVVERLTKDACDRIEKTHKKTEEWQHELSNMYPFKPQMSTFSATS